MVVQVSWSGGYEGNRIAPTHCLLCGDKGKEKCLSSPCPREDSSDIMLLGEKWIPLEVTISRELGQSQKDRHGMVFPHLSFLEFYVD